MIRVFTLSMVLFFFSIKLNPPLCAQSVSSSPREYVFTSWSINEGLPQSTARSVLQSRDGYLWIGTYGGLVRFDGVSFKVFDRFNTPELLTDRIVTLYEDNEASIWIGTEGGGLARFKNGQFFTYDLPEYIDFWVILSIVQDDDETIWFATDGAGVLRLVGDEFLRYTSEDGLFEDIVLDVQIGADGAVYAVSGKGIARYNGEAFEPFFEGKEIGVHTFFYFHQDRSGTPWIGTGGHGLYFLHGGTAVRFTDDERFISSFITTIFEDKNDYLWFGTTNGLARYKDGALLYFTTEDGLSDNYITSISEDHEGTIWVGTLTGGLNRLIPANVFVYRDGQEGAVNNITSISRASDGGKWYGLNCGGVLLLRDGEIYRQDIPLRNDCVWSVYEDSKENLWIGTWGGGLHRWNAGRLDYFGVNEGFPADAVLATYEDRDGTMWFGTHNKGVVRYENGDFTVFTDRDGLPHNDVRVIYQDLDGNLWFGTHLGLTKYNGREFKVYDSSDGVPQVQVRSIYQDDEGVLWFGTYGGGLLRYEDNRFTVYTVQDGLRDNIISHILEDESGNFWMGSNRGIFKVSKQDLKDYTGGKIDRIFSYSFGVEDGLISRETNGGFQPSALQTDDGKLWFPTIDGVAMIDPAAVRKNTKPPSVIIEATEIEQQVTDAADGISIQPGDRNFSITYTALSFIDPDKMEFRYKLEGFDSYWINAGNRREAYYTNIPPGNYVFRVIASNNDGVWNTTGASIEIVVVPPFWQTPWFQLVVGLFLLGSLTGIIYYSSTKKLKHRLEKAEQEHLLQAQKLESIGTLAGGIAHNFNNILNIIIGYASIMKENPKHLSQNVEEIINGAERGASLVKQLLVFAQKTEVIFEPVQVNDVIIQIKELLRQTFPEFIIISTKLQDDIPSILADNSQIHQVIMNLCHNARDAMPRGGVLSISTNTIQGKTIRPVFPGAASDTYVCIEVKDTGVGMNESTRQQIFDPFFSTKTDNLQGTGLGLASAMGTVKNHNGFIDVRSKPGGGAAFTVYLPVPKKEA